MSYGGRRPGAGRKPGPRTERIKGRDAAAALIEALNKPDSESDSAEIQWWRALWTAEDLRIRFDAGCYLYDKRDGKATQPVDHCASGPIKARIASAVERPSRG